VRVHSSNKGRQFSFQLNRLAVISSRLSSFSTSNLSSKFRNFAAIFPPSRRDVRLLRIASCVRTSKLLSWRRGIQIFRYRILNLTVSVYCRKNKCPVPAFACQVKNILCFPPVAINEFLFNPVLFYLTV